jgi:hypothetical protein
MIIAMTAPQTRPQPPYLIFPAFSGFIDNTSLNYVVIFLPVMTLRRMSWIRSSALAVFFEYEDCFHDETLFRNHREGISLFYSWPHEWSPFLPIEKPCEFQFAAVRIKGSLFQAKR